MNIEHVSTDMFQPGLTSPPVDGRKNAPGNARVLRPLRQHWPVRSLTTFRGAALALLVSALLTSCASPGPLRWAPRPPAGPTNTFPLPPAGTDVVGDVWAVVARHEDTLPDLARRFDLGYDEIAAANPGVDVWLPGRGTKVLLPTEFVLPDAPREGLVLNLASMRLFYYPATGPEETPTVVTHPVGIGREGWATPQGKTKVVSKKAHPSWTVPASILAEHAANGDPLPGVVPPGPDNPLGDYAMRLGIPGYLIHGTNKPHGVGMRVSHGCIRLYPEDIERLFPEVPVGTPVRIVNQPYLAGWNNGVLYLEAHPPLEEDAARWKSSLKPMERVVNKKLRASGSAGARYPGAHLSGSTDLEPDAGRRAGGGQRGGCHPQTRRARMDIA